MATPTFILPSAPTYTEGFVNGLNVYPNPTNFVANQVPFTRATTATRTNAAGLIELVPYNLLQRSEEFDNASWSSANNSGLGVAPVVTANAAVAPDGTTTADRVVFNLNGGTTTSDISRKRQIVSNQFTGSGTISFYVRSFDGVSNYTIAVEDSNGMGGSISVTGEWTRITRTATTYSVANIGIGIGLRGGQAIPDSNTADILIWGAQLVEGTDALPYLETTTRLNRPRVDFSLGGCPNLLLEPQRTNLLRFSEQFDNAAWTKSNATITANSNTSPSGVVNADTLVANVGTATTYFLDFTTLTGTGIFTASVFAKKGNSNWLYIRQGNSGGGTTLARAWFDLNNGTIGITSPAPISHKIEDYGNGWYRCSMTFEVLSGGIPRPQFYISNGDGVISFDSDGTQSINLWGAQLELGAYPTTYIPTTSASVTRNTDSFQLSNVFTNNMISSAGGTWFVDLRNNIAKIRDNAGGMFLGVDGNNCFRIRNISSALLRFTIDKNIAGTSTNLFTTTTDNVKLAIKWNGTTGDVFVNGVKVVTATAFTFTALQNLISSAGIPFNINSMALYNTPISDAECIQITT